MKRLSHTIRRLVTPDKPRPAWLRYTVAVVLPVGALGITAMFVDVHQTPFFLFFTTVIVLVSIYGGMKPGLVATLLSVLLNDLLLPPVGSLRLNDPEDITRVFSFAVIGSLISVVVGVIGDLERNLEVEREKLHISLTSIGDAVLTTDMEGRVTFMNSAAEAATGRKTTGAEGKFAGDVLELVNEATRESIENPVSRVVESGSVVDLANQTILLRPDGSEIPIAASAAPIRDRQGHIAGAVLVFRDVTRERQAQAAILQSEKLATLGRLAATIAHEVNNPLETIGNCLFLMENAPDLDSAKAYARTAQREMVRAAHAVRQGLSLARREEKWQPLELGAVVDDVLSLYYNRVDGNGIRVVKSYKPGTILNASASETRQVIANLLSNAFDALRQEGVLHLRVKNMSCDGKTTVRLIVADSGVGIAREDTAKVFDAFFTTKKEMGTGLGLWLTKQIVDAHGGHIRIRSRLGRGTVVRVSWPTSAEAQSRSAAPRAAALREN
jgi:PAS domain S-box-containing protein